MDIIILFYRKHAEMDVISGVDSLALPNKFASKASGIATNKYNFLFYFCGITK
jgi:hypothetical protein